MSTMSDTRQGQLESLADKNKDIAVILGLLLGPIGYVYVGQWRWAVINLVTLNYLMLGIVIVPIHLLLLIRRSRKKLEAIGTP